VSPADPVPYPLAKRLLDRVVAFVLLLIAAPVLLVLAVLMALDTLLVPADRGPWLYRERRISRGREFDLVKLRAVRADVLAGIEPGVRHAREYEGDASNLTWAGRHALKPWYLDELPQLWNILRGDMSLVGPRPWPPEMVERQRTRGLGYRDVAQAGWTGPAQTQKGVPGARYSDLDLAYVEACRTWPTRRLVRYDLGILRATLGVLLRREGLRY
jgi:lipopolysaccharide/colanic/teichoic acid biosynthesis glycosyltransferase